MIYSGTADNRIYGHSFYYGSHTIPQSSRDMTVVIIQSDLKKLNLLEKAGRGASMAGIAGLVNLRQQGITVAIHPHIP